MAKSGGFESVGEISRGGEPRFYGFDVQRMLCCSLSTFLREARRLHHIVSRLNFVPVVRHNVARYIKRIFFYMA